MNGHFSAATKDDDGAGLLWIRYAAVAVVLSELLATAMLLALRLAGARIPRADATLFVDLGMAIVLLPWLRRERSATAVGFRAAPPVRSVGLVILGLLLYGFGAVVWHGFVYSNHSESQDVFATIRHQSTLAIVLAALAAFIVAPTMEELFYRGFVYRALRQRLGIAAACILASLPFALIHFQYPLAERPVLALFGIITALMYEFTDSLLPGIALHSILDGSAFYYAMGGSYATIPAIWIVIGAVVLITALTRRAAQLLGTSRSG